MTDSRHAIRLAANRPEIDRELYERGIPIPRPPHPRLVELVANLDEVWAEANVAYRASALHPVPADPNLLEVCTAATGWLAPRLAGSEILAVDRAQVAALPDWPSRASMLATLTDARLPFGRLLIMVSARVHECPELMAIQVRDTGQQGALRWVGALLAEEDGTLTVAPIGAPHPDVPDEVTCPIVLRISRSPLPVLLSGEANLIVDGDGPAEVATWTPESDAVHVALDTALAMLDRTAMVLQVLHAANVETPRRTLSGKRGRRQRREQHPVPRVIRVQRTAPAATVDGDSGGGRDYSHAFAVRGHFAYFTRGPIFERNPQRRRWIPEKGCEAVPVWRPPHVKGNLDGPYVPKVRLLGGNDG